MDISTCGDFSFSASALSSSYSESHRNDSNPGGAGPNNEGVELLACDIEAAWARTTKLLDHDPPPPLLLDDDPSPPRLLDHEQSPMIFQVMTQEVDLMKQVLIDPNVGMSFSQERVL
ncbi:hypothetical protein WN943_003799 [Citrus x changshan-huyou]